MTTSYLLNANLCTDNTAYLYGVSVDIEADPEWVLSQYKGCLSRYGDSHVQDSHVKDKTVARPSHHQHGNPYTGKTTSLYWDSPWFLFGTTVRFRGMVLLHKNCFSWHHIDLQAGWIHKAYDTICWDYRTTKSDLRYTSDWLCLTVRSHRITTINARLQLIGW